MNKTESIKFIKKYIEEKPFSMDVISHLDENPIELYGYWVFKNLEEPRESIRGNKISINIYRPFVIINKLTKKVNEVNWTEYQNLKSSKV